MFWTLKVSWLQATRTTTTGCWDFMVTISTSRHPWSLSNKCSHQSPALFLFGAGKSSEGRRGSTPPGGRAAVLQKQGNPFQPSEHQPARTSEHPLPKKSVSLFKQKSGCNTLPRRRTTPLPALLTLSSSFGRRLDTGPFLSPSERGWEEKTLVQNTNTVIHPRHCQVHSSGSWTQGFFVSVSFWLGKGNVLRKMTTQ